MLWEYIFAVTVSLVYTVIAKGAILPWKLWITMVSFYWWLLAFYKFLTDQPFVPHERYQRKRPRNAVRKLYPGLARHKVLSIHPAWLPLTHAQNVFRSSIITNRWTSHFRPLDDDCKLTRPLREFYLWLWTDYYSAPIFEEINIMVTSLYMMTVHRFLILLLLLAQQVDFLGLLWWIVKWLCVPFKVITTSFDHASTFLAHLFVPKGSALAHEVFISVPTETSRRHPSHSKYWSRTKMAFATVYNLDQRLQDLTGNAVSFDSDAHFVVCDNSANTHICNDKSMFTTLDEVQNQSTVATIGGKNSRPSGIGTVKWSWDDSTGKTHEYELPNCYYFPNSPVNILSITEFAAFLKDDDGTGIDTKRSHSTFYWDHNKYNRKFIHSESNLPELAINSGNKVFAWFMSKFSRECDDQIHHTCCLTNRHVEDLANKCDETSNRDEPFLESIIYYEEKMIYKREGNNALVKILSSEMQDDELTFLVEQLSDGTQFRTTREFLHRPEQPEIANIPVTTDDFRATSGILSDEDLNRLAHPETLSPQEQEFLDMHHRLFHLPYTIMFRLAKLGVLPKHFCRLIKRPPPCASCLFGQAHRKPWRSKSTKDGKKSVLRGPQIKNPGDCIAVDQIVSAQPGLVPQDKGLMTRARIWGATVFVDYADSFTYVVLMPDLGGESTLAAKHQFEQACATRGVKVKHYHADNGRFAEPAWKEDCTAQGQRLTFCGVGAHHQNAIVERKIKDLTLTARTLLLHAQRHWPEYISQILWPFAIKCAAHRINNLHIDLDGLTPEMRFSQSPTATVDLRNFHTFGCPCYILDSRAQTDPKGVPKWEPRARLGIYLGHSPAHA